MRDRIAPYLFPWLPLFLVAAVWMHGNNARLDAAEDQAYSGVLPSMISQMLAEQEKELRDDDADRAQAVHPISTSGLMSDQRELFDGQ